MQMLNQINDIIIYPYFNLSEFACPCCNRVMLHPKLLVKLIELRKILERPVYITSGYRCSKYNLQIRGVANSYHRIGLAGIRKVNQRCLAPLVNFLRKE